MKSNKIITKPQVSGITLYILFNLCMICIDIYTVILNFLIRMIWRIMWHWTLK